MVDKLENTIWCFWMGGEITQNRKASIQSLIDFSGCAINLVSLEDLKDYEVVESPIHPAFKYLSAVHRSAVLRSYFMYHYGGGYTDVKRCDFSWLPYFDQLNNSSYSFLGYYEKARGDVAIQCEDAVKDYWANLVGNGCFIFKKRTDFAREWLKRTNALLDCKHEQLKQHPGWYHSRAIPNGIQGMSNEDFALFENEHKTTEYPISWGEPMGAIFQSLQFENKDAYCGGMPYINRENYI